MGFIGVQKKYVTIPSFFQTLGVPDDPIFSTYALKDGNYESKIWFLFFRRNCSHFCDDFCQHLGASWTKNMAMFVATWVDNQKRDMWWIGPVFFCYDESPCFWSFVCLCGSFYCFFKSITGTKAYIIWRVSVPTFLKWCFDDFASGELLWSLVIFVALQWGSVQGRICIHHVRHLIWRQPPIPQPFKISHGIWMICLHPGK